MARIRLVLVTGAAGFIGSHSVLELVKAGYDIVAIDNFSNSVPTPVVDRKSSISLRRIEALTGKSIPFHNVDICDAVAVKHLLSQYDFDCCIHFAALKAVSESVRKPLDYYSNNLIGTLVLVKALQERGVRRFIFSSSATVYGDPEYLPLTETHPVGRGLTNPYGQTKYMMEQVLIDLCRAEKGWHVILLRYFNPVGAHDSGMIGEDPQGIPNNLMPYVARVAVGKLPHVPVYGNDYNTPDGTGVRDYIHVVDLAIGHVAALKKIEHEEDTFKEENCKIYNLGTGKGYSVLEMIAALEKASGKKIPYEIVGRRDGDLASVYCDPSLAAQQLSWKAERGVDEMCRDMWRWQSGNPDGFTAEESASNHVG